MAIVFGKAFTKSFTAVAGNDPVAVNSLVSARIYSSFPTQVQQEDHTNALTAAVESVTSWIAGSETNEKSISFAAITDPSPQSTTLWETYWLVVSLKYDAAGSTVYIQPEGFKIWRGDAITSRMSISSTEVGAVESKILTLKSSTWIESVIDRAFIHLLETLRAKGYVRRKIEESDLNELVLTKSIAWCCRSLGSKEGDEWWQKYKSYIDDYNRDLATLMIGYDTEDDDDKEPEEELQAVDGMVIR